ncbi:MAG: hypothetical protein IJ740_14605 [Ruminococcus sp.]|nr:hypothetical protein [Ruminococcus sp.]
MGFFEKKEDAYDLKMELSSLIIKLSKVREQVGSLSHEIDRLGSDRAAYKAKSDELAAYAKKAVSAGSEQDAKVFLGEKYKYDKKLADTDARWKELNDTRSRAVTLHDDMVIKINDARTRLAMLEARSATADAAIKASQTVDSFDFEKDLSALEMDAEYKKALEDARRYAKGEE